MGRSEDMLSENQYRAGYYDGFVDAWSEIDNLLEGLYTNNEIQSIVEFYINYHLSPWLHSDCSVHVMPPIFDVQELRAEVEHKKL